jgi:hypothetical protein
MDDQGPNWPRDDLQRRLLVAQRLVATLAQGDFPLARFLADEVVQGEDAPDVIVVLAWYAESLARQAAQRARVPESIVVEQIGSFIAQRNEGSP